MDAQKMIFSQYSGKRLRLYFADGQTIEGKYVGYTPAYDNDPEIASINIDGIWHYSIDIPDIDHIDIID